MQKVKKILSILALCGAITASASVEHRFIAPEIKNDANFRQLDKIDSINNILSQAVEDTNKVIILNSLADCYNNTAPDKALDVSKTALDLSEKLNWIRGKAISLNNVGAFQARANNKEQNKTGIENCKKALKLFETLNDKHGIMSVYINLGIIYKQLFDYPSALDNFTKGINIAQEINDILMETKGNSELGILYWYMGKNDIANDVLEKGLALSRKIKNKFYESKCLGSLGLVYLDQSEYRKALDAAQESIIIKAEIGDKAGIANQFGNMANTCLKLSKYDEALNYYNKAVEIKLELGDMLGAARQYSNIGTLFRDLSDYSKALQYLMKGLDIFNGANEQLGTGNTLAMIGNLYIKMKEPQKALEYYYQSIAVFTEIGREQSIGDQYGNIATVYFGLNDYDKAIEYSKKALIIQEKNNHKEDLAIDYSNIAAAYKCQNNYEQALIYYNKSLKIREDIGDETGAIEQSANIALLHYKEASDKSLKLSDSARLEKISSSIDYLKKALAKYNEIGDKASQQYYLSNLSDAYQALGDYKNAFESYNKATLIKDSIFSIESKKAIANLEATKEAQLEKKAKELLEQDNIIKELEIAKKNQQVSLLENQQELQNLDLEKKDIQLEILNKNKNIQELEIINNKIEADNRESKISALEYKNEYQNATRNNLIIAFIFLSITLLILLFFYRRKRKDNKILIVKNQLISEQKEELTNLFNVVQDSEALLSEANATKDKFFSIIAHDLKNPIQTLILSSELLNRNYEKYSPEQFRDRLNKLSRTTIGISALLDTLLDWSRTQNGRLDYKPESAIIKKVVKEEFNLLSEMAERKQISLVDNTNFEMRVYADINMLTTILRNLISNAIKFSKNGGEISVSVVNNPLNGRNVSEIIVADNGIGMSENTKDKLFKLDSVGKTLGTGGESGAGLGLILCKEFVERHGGKILVDSELEKGSVFTIVLPNEIALPIM